MKKARLINYKHIDFWLLLILVTAIILHLNHFFFRTSMWFDELTCALNVRDHSFYQLATQSLDYNQIAPVGFLLLEKLSTVIIGVNDHAYRLFPLIFSLISLLLFLNISKQLFKGIALFSVFTLCVGSVSLWFYGGEAKQYSGDITASLFIVWSALQLMKPDLKKLTVWLIAIGGFILILCSLPAIVIAPLVLAVVFTSLLKKHINLSKQSFYLIAFVWGIACLLVALYAKYIISTTVQADMSNYWSRGFIPLNNIGEGLSWILSGLKKELNFFLTFWMQDVYPSIKFISVVLLILSVPGIIYLGKKYKSLVLILFTPLITALLLSIFRVLPFDSRVAVYATWPLVISGIAGIQALQKWIPRLFPSAVTTALSLAIALPILLITIFSKTERPPFNAQPTQLVLHELKKQWQHGDILFVYFKTRHALNFYGAKEGFTAYRVGGNYNTIEPHLRQLDSLKGNKRVWFIFSQWTEKQPFPDSIKTYLGTVIGKEIGKIPDPHGGTESSEAAAYLYDLSTNK
ncbi:MAG: hypothetical protein LH619_09155 [Chitinophagaceae bacterium]|nr:hypothetical protein [Chitinophagaceae bacterium]